MRAEKGCLSKNGRFTLGAIRILPIIVWMTVLAGAVWGQSKTESIETNLSVGCDKKTYTLVYLFHRAQLTGEPNYFADALHVVLKSKEAGASKAFGIYVYVGGDSRIVKRDDDLGKWAQSENVKDIDGNVKKFLGQCKFTGPQGETVDTESEIATVLNNFKDNKTGGLNLMTVIAGAQHLNFESFDEKSGTIQQLFSSDEFSKAVYNESLEEKKNVPPARVNKPDEGLRQQILLVGAENARLFNENQALREERGSKTGLYLFFLLFYLTFFGLLLWVVKKYGAGKRKKKDEEETKEEDKNLLWPPPTHEQLAKTIDPGLLCKVLGEAVDTAKNEISKLEGTQETIYPRRKFTVHEKEQLVRIQRDLIASFRSRLNTAGLEAPEKVTLYYNFFDKKSSEKPLGVLSKIKRVFRKTEVIKEEPTYRQVLDTIETYIDRIRKSPDDWPNGDLSGGEVVAEDPFVRITDKLLKISGYSGIDDGQDSPDENTRSRDSIKTDLEEIKDSISKLSKDPAGPASEGTSPIKEIPDEILNKIPFRPEHELNQQEAARHILKVFTVFEKYAEFFKQTPNFEVSGEVSNLQLGLNNLTDCRSDLEKKLHTATESWEDFFKKISRGIDELNSYQNLFKNNRVGDELPFASAGRILREREQLEDSVKDFPFAAGETVSANGANLPEKVRRVIAAAEKAGEYKTQKEQFEAALNTSEAEKKALEDLVKEKTELLQEYEERYLKKLQDSVKEQYRVFSVTVGEFLNYLGFRKTEKIENLAERAGIRNPENEALDLDLIMESSNELHKLKDEALGERLLYQRLRFRLAAGMSVLKTELEKEGRRTDVIVELRLEKILGRLHDFIGNIENWYGDDDELWKSGINRAVQNGWLDDLLRADRILQTYFSDKAEFDDLRESLKECSAAFESVLETLKISVLEFELLKLPAHEKFETKPPSPEFRKIPEIREIVLKNIDENPGQHFVVEMIHFGLKGRDGANPTIRVALLNLGQWPEDEERN